MSKSSIMIVEDNNIVMMELKDRLEEMNYMVVDTASSGIEAISKAHLHKPDLIMMDIRIKGEMDGIDTAGVIKDELRIPVIYLTAHSDDGTLQRAKLTEPYGYVIKPFEERELHSAIEMALYKHKMEYKLKESEHWLSTAINSIGDALIAADARGTIKLINPVAQQKTGWSTEEAFGRDINEVFLLEEEDGTENPLKKSFRTRTPVGAGKRCLISKDGSRIPVELSAAPIKDEAENITGIILVFRDITERLKAKELIEKQHNFLRNIIDTDPNYISVKNDEGRFVLINKATADAFGATIEEITGRPDEDFYREEEVAMLRKLDREILSTLKDIFIPEEKFTDANGKLHLLQTFKKAIDSMDGTEKLVLSVGSDITELKKTEAALRESDASKDKFFSIIAHDLRSPFNSLLGFSNHLDQEMDNLTKDELKMISGSIAGSVKNIYSLLENLLHWSRIKTGRMICDPEAADILILTGRIISLMKGELNSKGISYMINIPAGLTVTADINMLEMVLRNLITNAIKFTNVNGEISVSASQGVDYIEIMVADNGVGIDEERLKKMFKIDENISTYGTRNEQGSGLGLILCKEFIELNKGIMSVKSKKGQGSVFTLKFPKY